MPGDPEVEAWLAAQPEADLTDPDDPEWTEEDFARARPIEELLPPEVIASAFPRMAKRIGRPPLPQRKAEVKLRLDADVLAAWRASGPGWQTRMNDALRRAAVAFRGDEGGSEATG